MAATIGVAASYVWQCILVSVVMAVANAAQPATYLLMAVAFVCRGWRNRNVAGVMWRVIRRMLWRFVGVAA